MVRVIFEDCDNYKEAEEPIYQWNYGEKLEIHGLSLPAAVEIHFTFTGRKEAVRRIGITKDRITTVVIPEEMLEQSEDIKAYVYVSNKETGKTEKSIKIPVIARAMPEAWERPEDAELFRDAITEVNNSANRAENAEASANKHRDSAAQYAQAAQAAKEDAERHSDNAAKHAQAAQTAKEAAESARDSAEELTEGFDGHVADETAKAVQAVEDKAAEYATSVDADIKAIQAVGKKQTDAINAAGKEQIEAINTAGTIQKQAVETAGAKQVADVNAAGAEQREAIAAEGREQTAAVNTAGREQTEAVNAAGAAQTEAVNTAGAAQTEAVNTAGAAQTEAVNAAGAAQIAEIRGSVADLAPAIKCTAAGTDITLRDASEAPLSGMRVYGKTSQFTTTGAQLIDIDNPVFAAIDSYQLSSCLPKIESGLIYSGGIIGRFPGSYLIIPTHDLNTIHVSFNCAGGETINGEIITCDAIEDQIVIGRKVIKTFSRLESTDSFSEAINVPSGVAFIGIAFYSANQYGGIVKDLMMSATPLPYEPYTGGKPSPSPEYPQEMVSVGDSGSIETVMRGKNLFDAQKALDTFSETYQSKTYFKFENGKTYSLSCKSKLANSNFWLVVSHKGYGSPIENGKILLNGVGDKKTTFAIPNDGKDYYLFACAMGNPSESQYKDFFNGRYCTDIQIELGTTATPYEPYTAQTITHTTPNGLRGIPVDSGGNYTDENGQQWIADYRDWDRGVDVQMVVKKVFDGSEDEQWVMYNNILYAGFYTTALPEQANRNRGFCNQLRVDPYGMAVENGIWIGVNNSKSIYCINNSFRDESADDKGLSNWRAHLAEHPLEVMTYLDSPIETPIPAEELAGYRALHTNRPTTNITNDAGAHMEVTYTADTETYIDNNYVPKASYDALEARVAALEQHAIS